MIGYSYRKPKKVSNTGDKELEKVYSKYKKATNMTFSELLIWSRNPLSKKASLSRKPIRTNLRLLKKNKNSWTPQDIKDANKAISYLARAKKIKRSSKVPKNELTNNEIALRNWGYDVFKK